MRMIGGPTKSGKRCRFDPPVFAVLFLMLFK